MVKADRLQREVSWFTIEHFILPFPRLVRGEYITSELVFFQFQRQFEMVQHGKIRVGGLMVDSLLGLSSDFLLNKLGYHGDIPLVGEVDDVHEGIGILLFRLPNIEGVYDIEKKADVFCGFEFGTGQDDLCQSRGA